MNLPEISVRRPVAATMIMLIIMVLGAVSLTRLGLDFFPDMQFPQVSVVATYPGASSDEVETIITRPLEESTATVAGVRKVKSSSREGLSLIQAEAIEGRQEVPRHPGRLQPQDSVPVGNGLLDDCKTFFVSHSFSLW